MSFIFSVRKIKLMLLNEATNKYDKYDKYIELTRSKGILKYSKSKIGFIKKYLGSIP